MSYVDPQPCPNEIEITEPVTVIQGTIPWIIEGTIEVTPRALDCDTDSVTICTTEPLEITSSQLPVALDGDGGLLVHVTNPSGGGGGGLTDAELRALPVPVTVQEPLSIDDNGGSLTIDGTVTTFQGTSPWVVTVDNFPGPDESGLTDAQLRASPVPVSGTVSVTEPVSVDDNGGSLTVDGTVALDAPTLAALETIIVNQGTSPWVVNVDNFPASGTGLTDAELRASPVPVTVQEPLSIDDNGGSLTVDGSVSVSNFPATQPVSGTVALDAPTLAALETVTANAGTGPWPVTDNGGSLTVDGPLTDAQLRATPVPVSGTVSATLSEPISVDDNGGSLTVDGTVEIGATSLAALETIQVGSLPALPAGTNNIGDVDIASMPAGTLANGAETAVSSSAVSVLAADASRKKAIIQNTGVANVRVGVTGVTATTGFRLVPGGHMLLEMPNCPTNAIFAIREGSVDSIVFAQGVT